MIYGLPDHAVAKINGVFAQSPVIEKAVLYGSRAQGNYRNGSDIDLTLWGKISFPALLNLHTALDDLLLPWTIDLSIYDRIENPALQEHIRRVGKMFYEKEPLLLFSEDGR
ncbi:DNA polymerase [Planctomycetales bacterium]|nr:DNA polymerase [Planctomycetales bacterium]GHT00290.1 DNA polymerase [Planctomycetales bacterium]GHT03988.1 DNA polymerase [Planctomycetales bacterium]